MIERNLGNIERVTRFFLGVIFAAWALSQPAMNVIEWFITFVSLALILNGIFSRCYVWYLLDLDTNKSRDAAVSTTIC
tara:strand:+ start:407 stop:640 length:234 start_codon:yes stop_codon:yes gene_type:complete